MKAARPYSPADTGRKFKALRRSGLAFGLLGVLGLALAGGCVLDFHPFTPQDYYGKVIDQTGAPVISADVKATVVTRNPNYLLAGGGDGTAWADPGDSSDYQTKTDANGLFQFNVHGLRLYVTPSKAGYKLDGRALQLQADGKTSPADRAVFTMWKLSGAEPMVHTQLDSRVPYDGQSATFDLFAGKKSAAGDLRVTLTRTPQQVKRGVDHFDWNVKIEVQGEGLVEATDPYKNLAPQSGYQPALVFAQTKDNPKWTESLTKTFYVHTAKGQYGRVLIDLTMDSERPDTGISVETWLNPSGSRNLEFDEAKQIKP